MRRGRWFALGTATLIASGLSLATDNLTPARGDEPARSGLGRLFRLVPRATPAPGRPGPSPAPPLADEGAPAPRPASGPSTVPGPLPSSESSARIVPRPRVDRPLTDAEPILTRVAVCRADDGKSFCDFLQVYADGTVLDGGGVHQVSRATLKPLVDAIQATDGVRGHCGAPATDFIEQVHVVLYDRALGRLRARPFTYSGNPQGCDASVRRLHSAIEALQATYNVPTTALSPGAAPASPAPSPATSAAPPIPLTPTP